MSACLAAVKLLRKLADRLWSVWWKARLQDGLDFFEVHIIWKMGDGPVRQFNFQHQAAPSFRERGSNL